MQRVKKGDWRHCSQAERPFYDNKNALSIENGMLFKGILLYIPSRLRQETFQKLHDDNHSGIHTSISRVRLSAWWPNMNRDIERFVRQCPICTKIRPQAQKVVDHWPPAEKFERLHMDWAYVRSIGEILIIVDAGTGWIEAFRLPSRDSCEVIRALRTVFSRFGIPKLIVSDNAKEFISNEINQWLSYHGVLKRESPAYFPRSNGLAERAVQTVKRALKAYDEVQAHQSFNEYLQKVLFHHRVSSCSRGVSPSELVFGKKLRVPIVSPYEQGQAMWYKSSQANDLKDATFIMTKGRNTS